MLEFELDGYNFRAEKLSAFEQLHLSRKVAPLLPPLAPLFLKIFESSDPLGSNVLALAELAEPFALALAEMSDKDAEDVFAKTLGSVKVQTDTANNVWVKLWLPGANQSTVMALNDLAKLLPIVIRVITYNLGNFMDGLLTRHGEKAPASSGGGSPTKKTG